MNENEIMEATEQPEEKPNKMDTIYEEFLGKIKSKFLLYFVGSIVAVIIGIILLFTVSNDRTFGVCMIIFGMVICFYSVYHYAFRNKNNICVIKAKCLEKGRSGYRREYLEYTFQCEDDNSTFIIKTAQKEKFKKEIVYYLCFKKTNQEIRSMYTGANLLDFTPV